MRRAQEDSKEAAGIFVYLYSCRHQSGVSYPPREAHGSDEPKTGGVSSCKFLERATQPVEQVGFEVVFANMKFVFKTCL